MDPLSAIAGVVGVLDVIAKLSNTITRLRQDYHHADEELDIAHRHGQLLREEIGKLEKAKTSTYSRPRKPDKGFEDDSEDITMDDASFAQAMSTARELLTDIEISFPQCSEPQTWRSRMRYATKEKKKLAGLMERLQSAESTLNGIVSLEQLRVSRLICAMICRQQSTMDKIERGEVFGNIVNMAILHQTRPEPAPNISFATEATEPTTSDEPTAQPASTISTITRPNTLLPWSAKFNRWGLSGQLITIPRDDPGTTTYRAALNLSLLRRIYTLQLQVSWPKRRLSFDRMLGIRNLVPDDSDIANACRNGDFDRAHDLLTKGAAHGNDISASGWPVLDYAIESGSTRLVSLLLEYGADPNMTYGEHNMTPLQSCFLRGKLDIAKILIAKGANVEHLDDDGYSVLSYLWVLDKRGQMVAQFMALCVAYGFSEVNACDNRGWIAFHRAAAVGTAEDIETFMLLGASLNLRAEWYGWTAIFFAAAHDNVDTFEAIACHSDSNIYASLDGDGWGLLHCCIYFGAYRVMRLLLLHGVDVNQKSLPAPLPEDPELSYKELTPMDIAMYIGPGRRQMFMDALADTCRDRDLEDGNDRPEPAQSLPVADMSRSRADHPDNVDVPHSPSRNDRNEEAQKSLYDWTLMYWASYNGSPKVKKLLLMTGTDPEHLDLAEQRCGLGPESFSFECY